MEHTDQAIYDAHKMSEDEFVEYYKLYWRENATIVKEQRETIMERIKSQEYEIVCYLSADLLKREEDIFLRKSCVNVLKHALKAAANNESFRALNRCDTFYGRENAVKVDKVDIDIESVLENFESRYDQVCALWHYGITESKEIAELLGTNASYVSRLINRLKEELYDR